MILHVVGKPLERNPTTGIQEGETPLVAPLPLC